MFQKITPSCLYAKKCMISWGNIVNPSDQARLLKEDDLLIIKDIPDCVYVKDIDKLYFKNLNAITSILMGLMYCTEKQRMMRLKLFINGYY